MAAWLHSKIPLDDDVRAALGQSFQATTASVVRATFVAAAVQSALMFLGFVVLGVPSAFLAGGATFLAAMIPLVGSAPVWISGAIYLWLQGSVVKMVILAVIGLFIGVVDNVVRPAVLKEGGDMHPLVSLVAIFGGIKSFGMIGVFFGTCADCTTDYPAGNLAGDSAAIFVGDGYRD